MAEFTPSRREVLQASAGLALGSILPLNMQSSPASGPKPYNSDLPLHELQQRFLDTRMGMFVHYNMATYQDREWGDPTGPVELFNPTKLDTDQWAQAALSANMGYMCLTTKHHDGFPLWPTKIVKDHSKIDVVKPFVESCRKAKLQVGFYYSILDLRQDIRHFNVTKQKIDLIKRQITELLTQYGPIDFLIFDGWDAPWSRFTYKEIPFDEIYRLVKSIQPNCLVTDLNAGSYPEDGLYYGDLKAFEQNAGQDVSHKNQLPAISCVTLTDGWFWKQADASKPLKSVKQVVEDWLKPQNEVFCNLIVNAAPNREGRLEANLVARLKEIGEAWQNPGPMPKVKPVKPITTKNLSTGRPTRANASPDASGPDQANDGKFGNSWYLPSGMTEGWLEVDLARDTQFNTVVLVEPVGRFSDYTNSRIKSYRFQKLEGSTWVDIAYGNTPSSVQVHRVPPTRAGKVRLFFEASADTPHIAEIGFYNEP